MKPIGHRRLRLARTTVRALARHQLGQANGGYRTKSDYTYCGGETDDCHNNDNDYTANCTAYCSGDDC